MCDAFAAVIEHKYVCKNHNPGMRSTWFHKHVCKNHSTGTRSTWFHEHVCTAFMFHMHLLFNDFLIAPCSNDLHSFECKRTEMEAQQKWCLVSNRILTSCQPHRVTSGWSNFVTRKCTFPNAHGVLCVIFENPLSSQINRINPYTNMKEKVHVYTNIKHNFLSSPFTQYCPR